MQFLFMKRPWAWILTLLLSCPLTLWAEFVEVAPQVKIYYESSGQGEPLAVRSRLDDDSRCLETASGGIFQDPSRHRDGPSWSG